LFGDTTLTQHPRALDAGPKKFSQWQLASSLLVAAEPGKLTVNEMDLPQALRCCRVFEGVFARLMLQLLRFQERNPPPPKSATGALVQAQRAKALTAVHWVSYPSRNRTIPRDQLLRAPHPQFRTN